MTRQHVDESKSKIMEESAVKKMASGDKAYVFFSGGAERVIEELDNRDEGEE